MNRSEFIVLCQKASFKTGFAGAWWAAKWNLDELVQWRGKKYIPIDYRFGFKCGNATHQAIIHDMSANAEYTVKLDEVETVKNYREENDESKDAIQQERVAEDE